MYALLEELRGPRLSSTGLSLDKTLSRTVYWLSGSSLTKLTTVPVTEVYWLVDDETPSFASSEAAQLGPSYTLGVTSRYLYKLCLSRFDGRHNLAHAGTYLKCTRVLDLEKTALYWFISFTISQS